MGWSSRGQETIHRVETTRLPRTKGNHVPRLMIHDEKHTRLIKSYLTMFEENADGFIERYLTQNE